MTEARKPYDANTALLSHFPEAVRGSLHLIEKNGLNEVGVAVTNFVASFVHPDFVCNLADFQHVDHDVKSAVLEFFQYCLDEGMSVETQGQILAWITPYLERQGMPRAS